MFGVFGFLIIGFDIVWNIKVDYEVNVWFIDVYVECYCCYYNLQVIVLEFFLYIGVNIIFQFGMIGCCVNFFVLQVCSGVFYFCVVVVVDNV